MISEGDGKSHRTRETLATGFSTVNSMDARGNCCKKKKWGTVLRADNPSPHI